MASLWYCCGCTFGPHNTALYDACVSCGNKRCNRCTDVNNSSGSQCHHETSPYPSVIALDTAHTLSLDSHDLSPCVSEDADLPQIRPLPRPMHTAQPSRLGGSQLGPRAYMYICCKCQDGPKLYSVQPVCVLCSHGPCRYCAYVK